MVKHIEEYKRLLQRGMEVYTMLIQLYLPDKKAERDWADISASETTSQRNSLSERLVSPVVSVEDTSTLIVSIGHYLDSHWADYQEVPVANSEKRKKVEESHTELEDIIKGIAQINIALRTS